MTDFSDLGLSESVLRAVSDAGYEKPTPIQEKAIPAVLMNKDILGCAQTGTGKTASFTLPMIDILSQGRSRALMPRSVILEPTRELAAQVSENFETYGKYNKLEMALLIGGVSFGEQDAKISRGADVLIATPGRLMDHCERGKVILTDVKILVIDEADRMLDMGFIPDVEHIVSLMPRMRQTLMFSATMPKEIRRLAGKFLDNPKEISVSPPASTAETIDQVQVPVTARTKRRHLRDYLRQDVVTNALVFCNRKRDVATLYRSLEKEGFKAGALHGDMDQYKRMEWLEKFRTGEINVLVCSDVAARGLDIPTVSHVFNYDVPFNAEDYVHRIGRTGRAGRKGTSITFVNDGDERLVTDIEKLIGRTIPRADETADGESEHSGAPTEGPAETAAETEAETSADATDRKAKSKTKGKSRSPAKRSRARKAEPADAEASAAVDDSAADVPEPAAKASESSDEPSSGQGRDPAPRKRGKPTADKATGGKSGQRGDRRGRRGEMEADDVPADQLDKPFGETDLVPAFLRR